MREDIKALDNAIKIKIAKAEKRTAKDISDWIAHRAKNSGYNDCIENALTEVAELILQNYHVND